LVTRLKKIDSSQNAFVTLPHPPSPLLAGATISVAYKVVQKKIGAVGLHMAVEVLVMGKQIVHKFA